MEQKNPDVPNYLAQGDDTVLEQINQLLDSTPAVGPAVLRQNYKSRDNWQVMEVEKCEATPRDPSPSSCITT